MALKLEVSDAVGRTSGTLFRFRVFDFRFSKILRIVTNIPL